MVQAAVVLSKDGAGFYGGINDFLEYRGPELILEGPYETGKTYAPLTKLHLSLAGKTNCKSMLGRTT